MNNVDKVEKKNILEAYILWISRKKWKKAKQTKVFPKDYSLCLHKQWVL